MKINYDLKFQEELKKIGNNKPSLLLHVCCGPCSGNVIKDLLEYFNITIYYSNSNIYPNDEYHRRYNELLQFINSFDNKIKVIEEAYEPKSYLNQLSPLKDAGEGSKRCFKCYSMRMTDAYNYANKHNYDYWTTVLSVSPHKNSQWINEIGGSFNQDKSKFLYSDFKKNNGYFKSVQLAKEYKLYRQEYCGCVYSYQDMLKRKDELS